MNRLPKGRQRSFLVGAWLLLLCLGIYHLQWAIEESRPVRPPDQPLYLPNGNFIKVVSLGYDAVMADFLWLYSIQYAIQEFWGKKKYRWLHHIFNLITDLDPQFETAYVMGAIFLGMMQTRPDLAIDLLDKGAKANPDSWIYPSEASFYAALHLKDRRKAMAYLEEASTKPGFPVALKQKLARYYHLEGKTELAIRQWLSIEENAESDAFRKLARESLLRAMNRSTEPPEVLLRLWKRVEKAIANQEFKATAKKKIEELTGQIQGQEP